MNKVNSAIEQTQNSLKNSSQKTPSDILAQSRYPRLDAFKAAKAEDIFEMALLIMTNQSSNYLVGSLSSQRISLLANLSGCTTNLSYPNCSDWSFHSRYRTFDGSCNNLNYTLWGASMTPFRRVLSPIYENGFNTPVGWNMSRRIPSARLVSREIVSTKNVTDDTEYTHMLMQWGQFLDHDLDLTASDPSKVRFNDSVPCNATCQQGLPCFPIQIPENDPRFQKQKCMNFVRSAATCRSGVNVTAPRQQINQITSYIDASNVYGSSDEEAKRLRDLNSNNGTLKVGLLGNFGKHFLPFDIKDCQLNKSEGNVSCFLAGDSRSNEQLALTAIHTLWMREHNRIANSLAAMNPSWNAEKIYQEARKIVGAEMQHITFKEWLPKILGSEAMAKIGQYKNYNSKVDASIFNSFATSAFRFGHSMIQPVLTRLNESFLPIQQGNIPLHKSLFSPFRLVHEGGIDPLLRGLFGTAAKSRVDPSEQLNTEVTERLFQMAKGISLDLAALNIQRGRDHGLPGYNKWREYCNMSVAETFDDLSKEITNLEVRAKLQEIYSDPSEIDLFVGGLLEESLEGGRLGPVFTCLLSLQFKHLRSGDRFWYENPGVFTSEQLMQLKQV